MRHPEIDYWIVMERRRDELAAAEQSRLITSAIEADTQSYPARSSKWAIGIIQAVIHLAGRGLYWLGERFEGLGCQLQVRFAAGGRGQPASCE